MSLRRKIVIAAIALLIAAMISVREYRHSRESSAPFSSAPLPSGPCIDFRQAPNHTGENACITGRVLRAFTSRAGNTFLDFCEDYRTCPFTSVIFRSDHSKFGNLEMLEGQSVELRGFISIYRGQAEIIIHDPAQIRLAQ